MSPTLPKRRFAAQRPFVTLLAFAVAAALVPARPAHAVKRRAFATSVAGNGNLSTWPDASGATALDRADSVCRARAAAAGLPNAGTYRAWLSTSTTDAFCHVQGLSGQKIANCNVGTLPGAGPWYLANGITNFTASLDALTGSAQIIFRPVHFDENLTALPQDYAGREYWTGTDADGTFDFNNTACNDWTSASAALDGYVGDGHAAGEGWTYNTYSDCSQSRRLLCLEPGASETTVLGWSPAAVVFLTSATGTGALNTWPEADGLVALAAGDRICQNEAAAAHLPEPSSFVAWLSDPPTNARDRVTTNYAFRRLDNYAIANGWNDLVDGALATSVGLYPDGSYWTSSEEELVWTGTASDGTSSGETCVGWTDGSGSFFGTSGSVEYGGVANWTEQEGYICSRRQHLYCISNVITIFWDGFDLTGDASRWSIVNP